MDDLKKIKNKHFSIDYGFSVRERDLISDHATKESIRFTIGVLEDLQKDFMDKFFIKSAKDIQDKISELKQLLNEAN